MSFFNPVQIIFGSGVRKNVANECKNKKILIICSLSSYKRYQNDTGLKDLFNNYEILLEHTFSSNPSIIDMDNISNKYKDESIDIIIGIGGG